VQVAGQWVTTGTTQPLIFKNANGCRRSDTLRLAVNDSCLVYYPNVFTPDGDGVNDRFYLLAFPCVQRVVSFAVVSRWGDVVFSRTDVRPNEPADGWDGTASSGEALPTDVFVWSAEIEYYDGRRQALKGEVTLLR
jgi:gliding motility-associated-like protein